MTAVKRVLDYYTPNFMFYIQSPVSCKLYADDVKLYTESTADESYFQGRLDLLYL